MSDLFSHLVGELVIQSLSWLADFIIHRLVILNLLQRQIERGGCIGMYQGEGRNLCLEGREIRRRKFEVRITLSVENPSRHYKKQSTYDVKMYVDREINESLNELVSNV